MAKLLACQKPKITIPRLLSYSVFLSCQSKLINSPQNQNHVYIYSLFIYLTELLTNGYDGLSIHYTTHGLTLVTFIKLLQ